MKRFVILACLVLLLTGCVNVNLSSYEEIASSVTSSSAEIYNTYRKGYKFYLPIGLYVQDAKEYNEVIKSKTETFYLYIDLISYLNKNEIELEKGEYVFSKVLDNSDKKGYIVIKNYENDKYLVEIVYNYAKIEVIVDKDRAKACVGEALIILSSIKYNDSFLTNLSSESLLNYKEEMVDIFEKGNTTDTSNFLEYVDEYDGTEQKVPDYDLIN